MSIYIEPKKKINVQLDIEEIILIKESLFDSEQKQKAFERNPRTSAAFAGSARRKSEAMRNLADKLSIYGYGYEN